MFKYLIFFFYKKANQINVNEHNKKLALLLQIQVIIFS